MLEFSNCRYNLSVCSCLCAKCRYHGTWTEDLHPLKSWLVLCFDIFVHLQRKHWCMFFFTNIYINTCEKLRLNNS